MAAKKAGRVRKSDAEDEQKKKDGEEKSSLADVVDTAGAKPADDDDKDKLDKSDGDDEEEDAEDEGDDYEDEDGEDEDAGEFRFRISNDGTVRLVMNNTDEDDSDDDEDEDDTQDDEDTDDMEQTDKSQNAAGKQRVSAEGLQKALEAMNQYAQHADVGVRRQELMRRAGSKAGLSKSEARELFVSLGGAEGKSKLSERLAAAFDSKGQMAKSASAAAEAQDAFAYLEDLNGGLSKSLSMLADEVEQSSARQHGANLLLCKAVARIGAAVKAMSERVDTIGQAPARAPKSISAQAVSKSFAGAPAQDGLTREDAIDLLTKMNKSTIGTARPGLSKGNRDLVQAIDVLMTSGNIDQGLLAEIEKFKTTGRLDG